LRDALRIEETATVTNGAMRSGRAPAKAPALGTVNRAVDPEINVTG
jgi:hypothetical protein